MHMLVAATAMLMLTHVVLLVHYNRVSSIRCTYTVIVLGVYGVRTQTERFTRSAARPERQTTVSLSSLTSNGHQKLQLSCSASYSPQADKKKMCVSLVQRSQDFGYWQE